MKTIPEYGRPYDEVLNALDEYGMDDPDYKDKKTWSLVYYKDARREAFAVAEGLRASGLTVEMCLDDDPIAYAKAKDIAGIVSVVNETDVEIINTVTGEKANAKVTDFTGGEEL